MTTAPRPLIATNDPALLDELLAVADDAETDVLVVHTATNARRFWPSAPLVIAGDDLADDLAREDLPIRNATVVGTHDPETIDRAGLAAQLAHANPPAHRAAPRHS